MPAKSKKRRRLRGPKVVRLIANVEDVATGIAYNEYEFRTVGGETRRCLVDRSAAADPRALADILLKKNADLPADLKQRNGLLLRIIKQRPQLLAVCAAKVGWTNDEVHGFVRHTGVTGNLKGDRKLRPPLEGASRYRPKVRGTSNTWSKKIGSIVRWSSRLLLASAATFVAPLVRLVRLQPFTIVFFGASSVGKSSIVIFAGSIIGQGSKEEILNWNTTKAALSESACDFNDHVFLIDETGSTNLPRAKQYELMKATTYTYAEGVDALRHSRSGYATTKAQADAKGILITTSEYSFDELAALSGQERDEGEIARAINVPATSPGSMTIFDIWPKDLAPEGRAK